MITCGITGGNGVLGSALVNKYQNKIKFIKFEGDITKKKNLISWFKKNDFDFIVHFAAIVPTGKVDKNYNYANKVNVEGTINLANLVLKNKNICWFFFSSTSHVYKNNVKATKLNEKSKLEPYSNYGKTKLKAEKILIKKFKKSKINLCIGRIFSFTNHNQDKSFFVPNIFRKIKSNKNIELIDLNHFRDFISVNDICSAVYFLYNEKYKGIINICSGKKINLITIVQYFAKKFKKKITINNQKKPSYLVGDNGKLKKIGWKQKDSIRNILNDYFKKKNF